MRGLQQAYHRIRRGHVNRLGQRVNLGYTKTKPAHNPLGVMGCGEAGAIAAPPAVINAVIDALRPLGVKHIDMPATPERVWQAIQSAS